MTSVEVYKCEADAPPQCHYGLNYQILTNNYEAILTNNYEAILPGRSQQKSDPKRYIKILPKYLFAIYRSKSERATSALLIPTKKGAIR